jgi:hypothetical protein
MLTYRSVVEVPEDAQLERSVRSEVNAWLGSKGYDASDLGPAWQEIAPGTGAVWLEYPVGPDGAVRARLNLAEVSGWGTQLTFSAGGNRPGWLWVDVHSPDGRQAKVPRLVRNLLPLVDAWDGLARLEERCTILHAEDVTDLIDVLCDPQRRGVIFVAGTTAVQPGQPWRELVDAVAKDTVGLAATYLLDSAATVELEAAVGQSYATPGGAIRTYLPEVDPASVLDSRRHRILGAERLASSDVRDVRRLLADVARRQTLGAALPRDVVKVDRLLDRLQTTELVSTWQSPRGRHVATTPAPVALHTTELDVVSVPEVTVDLATVTEVEPDPIPPAVALPGGGVPATTAEDAPTELVADGVLPPDQDLAKTTATDAFEVTPTIDVLSVETHLALVAGMGRVFGAEEPTPDLVDRLVALAEQSLAAQDTRASVEQRLDALQTRLEATEDRELGFANQADEAEQNFAPEPVREQRALGPSAVPAARPGPTRSVRDSLVRRTRTGADPAPGHLRATPRHGEHAQRRGVHGFPRRDHRTRQPRHVGHPGRQGVGSAPGASGLRQHQEGRAMHREPARVPAQHATGMPELPSEPVRAGGVGLGSQQTGLAWRTSIPSSRVDRLAQASIHGVALPSEREEVCESPRLHPRRDTQGRQDLRRVHRAPPREHQELKNLDHERILVRAVSKVVGSALFNRLVHPAMFGGTSAH